MTVIKTHWTDVRIESRPEKYHRNTMEYAQDAHDAHIKFEQAWIRERIRLYVQSFYRIMIIKFWTRLGGFLTRKDIQFRRPRKAKKNWKKGKKWKKTGPDSMSAPLCCSMCTMSWCPLIAAMCNKEPWQCYCQLHYQCQAMQLTKCSCMQLPKPTHTASNLNSLDRSLNCADQW